MSFLVSTPGGNVAFRDSISSDLGWVAFEMMNNPVVYAIEGVTGLLGSDMDLLPIEEYTDAILKSSVLKNQYTESTWGQIGRGIGQFVTGFFPIFGAVKKIKALSKPLHKVLVADAVTSGTVFADDDPNTFNMVQHVPLLKDLDDATGNAVTKLLASDPDDPELMNRFRNATVGVLEGQAIDNLFKLLS